MYAVLGLGGMGLEGMRRERMTNGLVYIARRDKHRYLSCMNFLFQ